MEYTDLTDADRYWTLLGKLRSYEQQHFDATINAETADAAGVEDAAEKFRETIAQTEAACTVVRARLAELPVPEGPPPRLSHPRHERQTVR